MEDLQQVAKILNKNHFDARVVETVKDAVSAVMDLIPKDVSVGFGGSVTVRDLGLYEGLKEQGHDVFWHWMVDADDRNATRKSASNADYYLLSANALTKDGEIINTDGTGNRVSAMFYGPKHVIFIVGRNKLVADYTAGIDRIRNVASPLNAKRLGYNTPCAVLGRCTDCDHQNRMCNITGVLHRPTGGIKMHVILVNEDLGY